MTLGVKDEFNSSISTFHTKGHQTSIIPSSQSSTLETRGLTTQMTVVAYDQKFRTSAAEF